ncbi:hypothetical protein D9M73_198280 [compost metagenome]
MLRVARKVESGWSRVKRTVCGSRASIFLINAGNCIDCACGKPLWATLCHALAGSSMRSKLKITSSALRSRVGVKYSVRWNFTCGCNLNT